MGGEPSPVLSEGAGTVAPTVTATRGTPNRSGAKKKPAPRSSSKRPPAKKPAASTRSRKTAPPPEPPFTVRMLDALAHASRGHGADFAGIVLIVVGVVAGMGVYADAGGPVGRGTADLVGFVVGAARVIMPILFVVLGALLIRGVPAPKATSFWSAASTFA